MVKPGDIVRFLNSVGGGKVTRIEGKIAYVEDSDGFESPVLARELVVTTPAGDSRAMHSADLAAGVEPASVPTATATQPQNASPSPEKQVVVEDDFEETPEGEKLNIVLGYEPIDIKRLSESEFETYLINDSNYFLLFTYLTQDADTAKWSTRYAGRVEPGIQLLLGELNRDELSSISRIAIQYIAFKDNEKTFEAKQPAWVEYRFDATKFFKLHCFRENIYFDNPVIAFDIVRDDRPCHEMKIDEKQLQQAIREKKNIDMRPNRKPVQKKKQKPEIIEVDLHIAQLVDTTAGMSASDMLNLQIDRFRAVMDENLRNHGQKIVFIHGKGEGVLRQALLKELNHRYKGHDIQDASFREYGFGATQVTIK